jgi:hypothetical protein
MRKQFILATALGTAAVGVLPLTAAAAATHSQAHRAAAVLTTGKTGGTAVKRGATLQAALQKGSAVTFLTPGTKNGVTCKTASFKDKVTKNPPSPGFARELLTSQTFGKCGVHGVAGATGVKSIAVKGLPYKTTIGGKSHGIALFKARTLLTLKTVIGPVTCSYGAAAVKGTASNVGQVNKFTDQTFTLLSGSSACPKKGNFSATFGPVKDTSVKNSPHVFVN